MRLRLTVRAVGDLIEISDYLRERSPVAALRVRGAIEAGFKLISEYPHVGRRKREGIRRLALPRYPYLIFYSVVEIADEVRVLTIRHSSRKEET